MKQTNESKHFSVDEVISETEKLLKKEHFLKASSDTKLEVDNWKQLFAEELVDDKTNKAFTLYLEVKNEIIDISISLSGLEEEMSKILGLMEPQNLTLYYDYIKAYARYRGRRDKHQREVTKAVRASYRQPVCRPNYDDYEKAYDDYSKISRKAKKVSVVYEAIKIKRRIRMTKKRLVKYYGFLEETLVFKV